MKYLLLFLALIFLVAVIWVTPTSPSETGIRIVRGDTGKSVTCDGADQPETYRKLQSLFQDVEKGESFEVLIEPLPLNEKTQKAEILVQVFSNGEVSLTADDDTGAITRSPDRGSSSAGSGDYIAMTLMAEVSYPFKSSDSMDEAARGVERILGHKFPNSGEQDEALKP